MSLKKKSSVKVKVSDRSDSDLSQDDEMSQRLCTRMRKKLDPRRLIVSVFPILQWSRHYNAGTALGDLIAGITMALTMIPQSIAYASLAGFEPQYGLYASFMGGFVYAILGTCPQISIGPSALLSLMTYHYTHGTNPDFAVLLCFAAGIIQMVAGIAQLGFLVDFVSLPVVSGFTSAAAFTIASAQIKGLLGLTYKADTFMTVWKALFESFREIRMTDTLLSLSCCVMLLGMQHMKNIPFKKAQSEKSDQKAAFLKNLLWFISVARNAVVVIMATVVAYLVYNDTHDPLFLTGNITPGLQTPQVPAFETTVDGQVYSLSDMLSHLGSGLIVVPMVAILGNIAIAKAFAKGRTLDATQEIVALGACNLVSAFFVSMPVNGSFSRSAVSEASGVRTPAAGLYTGVLVILTLVLLTPYFYFIPRAALASVIVCAVLGMVDVAIVKKLWRSNKLDLIPLAGCFFFCLGLGIEIGLLCGVLIDVVLILYYQSRPPLDIQYVSDSTLPPHFAIRPVGSLNFAGAEKVRGKLLTLKHTEVRPNTQLDANVIRNDVEASGIRSAEILVIHCDALHKLDYTFLQSLRMLVQDWGVTGGRVIFCNAKSKVQAQLDSVLNDPIYCKSEQLPAFLASTVEEQRGNLDTTL